MSQVDLVKPDGKLAPGSRIDVWCEPDMVEEAVHIYHEQILAIAAKHCKGGKWQAKDPKTIDFGLWPERIREITQ